MFSLCHVHPQMSVDGELCKIKRSIFNISLIAFFFFFFAAPPFYHFSFKGIIYLQNGSLYQISRFNHFFFPLKICQLWELNPIAKRIPVDSGGYEMKRGGMLVWTILNNLMMELFICNCVFMYIYVWLKIQVIMMPLPLSKNK